MQLNCSVYITFLNLQLLGVITDTDASILNTLIGVPSECIHQTTIYACKLSFSCWLQGGKHAKGCGTNKWLFSCCVIEKINASPPAANVVVNVFKEYNRKVTNLPQRIILKRRNDNELFRKPECGLPYYAADNTKILQKRIIGGRPAKFAEYPWQAHIRIAEYQCGGALISNNIIATAAHCIQQARLEDISIFLGELDTQNLGQMHEPLPVEEHTVALKIVHPNFRYRMTQPDRYDLALLKLARPTGFSQHILPICLPQHVTRLAGRRAIVAGWGKTEASIGHSGTNLLQVASVPIISAMDCLRWHESKQINVELFNEMFCAGHPDGHQDACLGDSGGPLVIKDYDRFVLVGITSAGFGCGVDHQPGIYFNIQKATKWIQDMIVKYSV